MPTRDKVIETLSQHQTELQQNFGVESLRLFGSVARNESNVDSDIDLLVEFVNPPGLRGYMALKFHLEALLTHPVDLVMDRAVKPFARSIIEQEAVNVT